MPVYKKRLTVVLCVVTKPLSFVNLFRMVFTVLFLFNHIFKINYKIDNYKLCQLCIGDVIFVIPDYLYLFVDLIQDINEGVHK